MVGSHYIYEIILFYLFIYLRIKEKKEKKDRLHMAHPSALQQIPLPKGKTSHSQSFSILLFLFCLPPPLTPYKQWVAFIIIIFFNLFNLYISI